MLLLFQLLRNRSKLVFCTLSISAFGVFITLLWNSRLSTIINIINDKNYVPTSIICIALLIILLSTVTTYSISLICGWTCEIMTHDLRMGYAKHVYSLPIIIINEINSGEQLSKLQNEIADISLYLRTNLFQIVDDSIRFIITLSWMLYINPKLTILAHLPVLFIMLYIIYSSRVLEGLAHNSQKANAAMCGYIENIINLFPILKIFHATKLICSEYNGVLETWEELSSKEEFTRAKLMSLSALLSCIPLLLLFFIGGAQVIHGDLTIGTLYIFINLSGNVSGILMNMPGRISALRRFTANMNRMSASVLIERGR